MLDSFHYADHLAHARSRGARSSRSRVIHAIADMPDISAVFCIL